MSLNFNEVDNKMYTSNENENEEIKETANEAYNEQLRDRIMSLKNIMHDLKTQLKNEKENWEKEMQEICNLENSTPQQKTELYNIASDDLQHINCVHNMPIFDDNYIQVESQNLQRQLAISNYRRRLLEVENMCNLELMRVKQSVTFLQPLRVIASEWESSKEPDECGECLYSKHQKCELQSIEEKSNDSTVSMDIINNNKFAGDINDIFSKTTYETYDKTNLSNKLNGQNEDKKFHSRSTLWCPEYIKTE